MKNILLLTTGGTIASVKTDKGLIPGLSGEWLLERIPEVKSLCNITIRPILNIDSSNISSDHWLVIANAIYEGLDEYDGIVITHGTDTMAYTTAVVSYMIRNLKKPVVFTGSQLPIDEEGSDGIKNLYQAFQVANSDITGVSLVFNGKVIRGTRAFKIHSINEDAFVSCNYPYLGHFENGELFIDTKEISEDKPVEYSPKLCSEVFLLKVIPGIKPSIVDYIASEGYKGVVVEAFGLGGIPSEYTDLLERFEKMTSVHKIPVIVVSQCLYDGTNLNVYNVGVRAEKAGLISGRDMTPEAAATKLMWSLAHSDKFEDIKELFSKNLSYEVTDTH